MAGNLGQKARNLGFAGIGIPVNDFQSNPVPTDTVLHQLTQHYDIFGASPNLFLGCLGLIVNLFKLSFPPRQLFIFQVYE